MGARKDLQAGQAATEEEGFEGEHGDPRRAELHFADVGHGEQGCCNRSSDGDVLGDKLDFGVGQMAELREDGCHLAKVPGAGGCDGQRVWLGHPIHSYGEASIAW